MNFKKRVNDSWADIPHYIHNTSTDTITTLPAVIYPTGTAATVGLKGQTVQSSTPSPISPVMPQGTGERTGNLFELTDSSATSNTLKTLIDFGTDVTYDTFTCSCVFDNLEAENAYGAFIDYLMDDGTHQYIALSSMLNVNDDTRFPTNVKVNGNYYNTKRNITFRKIQVYLYTTGYNNFKSGIIKWAFYDSEKKDYEPYGYKIPISSTNITTPVYLGEVQTTRKIRGLVLTGEEAWMKSGAYQGSFYAQIVTNVLLENYTAYCSHLTFSTLSQYAKGKFCFNGGIIKNCNLWFNQFDSSTTVSDFKSYLATQYAAGTPVTVWYVLATPETAVVNEPLMKIGDYADTLSNISIPVTAGGDTISIGTTLQPSEVTVNYKGWHPVADVHERENGAWT